MIPLNELFFHSTRRVGRLQFAFGAAVLLAAWWAVETGLAGWAAVPPRALVGYCALCLLSLRLHDIGRSGWWSWLIVATAILARALEGPAALVMAIAGGLALLALLLRPGQNGLNRHGPPAGVRLDQASG